MFFFPALLNLCWGWKILKPQSHCVYFFSEKETVSLIWGPKAIMVEGTAGRKGMWRVTEGGSGVLTASLRKDEAGGWRRLPHERCVQRCHPQRTAEGGALGKRSLKKWNETSPKGATQPRPLPHVNQWEEKGYAAAWGWIWWLRSEQRKSYANTG